MNGYFEYISVVLFLRRQFIRATFGSDPDHIGFHIRTLRIRISFSFSLRKKNSEIKIDR